MKHEEKLIREREKQSKTKHNHKSNFEMADEIIRLNGQKIPKVWGLGYLFYQKFKVILGTEIPELGTPVKYMLEQL